MFEVKSTKFSKLNTVSSSTKDQIMKNEDLLEDNISKRIIGSSMFEESMKILENMINKNKFDEK